MPKLSGGPLNIFILANITFFSDSWLCSIELTTLVTVKRFHTSVWTFSMKSTFVGLAALGYNLNGANAKLLRWGADQGVRRWEPAEKTLGVFLMAEGMSPKPTEAPKLPDRDLSKRATNVCGYISGISCSYKLTVRADTLPELI
jgi:hypothetical protein